MAARKGWRTLGAALIGMTLLTQSIGIASAADLTTKYRVYQNDNLLREFSTYNNAVSFARQYNNSYVEEIGSRNWLWDNFQRYKVYQNGTPLPWAEFSTLEAATAEARRWANSSVRDTQGEGWSFSQYAKPGFRLYQGEITLNSWFFTTLDEARAEARKWANAHVIDLSTMRWVWDNYSDAAKATARSYDKVYQVFQGSYTTESWKFAYLEDAINESLKWANSTVVNIGRGTVIHSNIRAFHVLQHGVKLNEHLTLDEALQDARRWDHAVIKMNGKEIWNNYPYFRVYQNTSLIGEFKSIKDSVTYAMRYANSSIQTYDGLRIWNNFRKLQYWAWNGTASSDTIRAQVKPTQGLDVDSPSWFTLADAEGNLTDKSSADMVRELQRSGIKVHPLVHNQFNASMTSQFLANKEAQQKFIRALVDRCAALGAEGINVDFEEMAASDRNRYTEFLRMITKAAHEKGLVVSVDLPRGSAAWNAKTTFDHEQIAQIVDYVAIMAYDQHWSGAPNPGSVAGLQWVEQGIKEFLAYGIQRDKLLLGIPFYVREWKLDAEGKMVSNRAVIMDALPKLMSDKKAVKTWDDRFQQYKVEYKEGGFTYVFWLEDEITVKARLDLAKKYELAGVAAWRLGYEPDSLWTMMIREK